MISKREDGVDVLMSVLATDHNPLPERIDPIDPPSVDDTATLLVRQAKNENTWEGARAALLRAMQLTRERERDERERDQQQNGE